MSDLRKQLELKIDLEFGPFLELDDWEHRDYIEDVLAEHFDIEYAYMVEDRQTEKSSLYFRGACKLCTLEAAINEINGHHLSSKELYKVV